MSVVCSGGVEVVGLKDHVVAAGIAAFTKAAENENENEKKRINGFFLEVDDVDDVDDDNDDDDDDAEEEEEEERREEPSESSSTIGVESSLSSLSSEEDGKGNEGEGEEEEVQSKEKVGLGSLDSLEESLPIKRGLSNFFSGKSKSFATLSDAATATAKDLAKPENPFNKRRRILMACARRASYSSLITSTLPALLSPEHTVEEEEEEEDEDEDKDEDEQTGENGKISALAPLLYHHQHHQQQQHLQNHDKNERRKMTRSFKSPRSFSLSDLQHV